YANKGDRDRAIADYNEAIRLDPENAMAFNNRGASYANKGDRDRAIADYNEAIRLNPNFSLAFTNLNKAKNDRAAKWGNIGDWLAGIAMTGGILYGLYHFILPMLK